jgi:hypothetical protein
VSLKFAPLPRMQLQLTVLLSVGMVSVSYFYVVYSIGGKTALVMDLSTVMCMYLNINYLLHEIQSWKKFKTINLVLRDLVVSSISTVCT